MKKTILVSNDDGIYGPGLNPLVRELKKIARVVVVVPEQERSGSSHAITLHKPFRVQKIAPDTYMANGTPADCVKYGVRSLIKGNVDLVVSGINAGPNLGQDVIYSGTVAGAREGALLGIPSFAASSAVVIGADFGAAAKICAKVARRVLKEGLPEQIYLNINIPPRSKGVRVAALGKRIYDERVEQRTDPRGKTYFWLAGRFISGLHRAGTDITTVKSSFTALTPLKLDPTALEHIKVFEQWTDDLS